MKKQLIIYTALLSSLSVYSQGEVTLSSAYTGGSVTACSKVSLKPGFSYKATSGKNISLKVSPSTCDPFEGKDIDAMAAKEQNYIRTKTYLKEDQTRYLDQIQYFDGLGRPIQTVQRGITPGAKDLATYQEYDPVGRESLAWLPGMIDGNNGKFVEKSVVADKSIITNADTRPYTEPVYEPSPLNRITAQFGPGEAWKSNPAKTEYLTNDQTALLSCLLYTITGTRQAPTLSSPTKYATGELYVTKVTDEDNNPSYEFKDKLGQVVLTRQVAAGVNYDTYYVYDDYGNLCFVLPPLIEGKTDATTLGLYAYQYKYNDRNLCISKKLPGCDWIYYVYDKTDRLILTQDGEQRVANKWSFTKYDDFGRIILTGIAAITGQTHASLQTTYKSVVVKETSNASQSYGYTWSTLSEITSSSVLTANYYDDIERILSRSTDFKTKLSYSAQSGYGTKHSSDKGLLVGTRVMYTDETGNVAGEITTAMYYDIKGQLIQTQSINHKNGTESEYIAYNFTGQPTQKKHIHKYPGLDDQTETYTYEYDHAGRLLTTTHKLNTGAAVILAQNTYDDLGRLSSTTANNQTALKTNYTYNVRSWTKSISNPLFSQTLYYNDQVKAHSYGDYQPSYTGNISGEEWSIQGEAKRSHRFKYDGLSRLIHSAYNGVVSGGTYNTAYSYDKHGNVLTLVRNSGTKGAIDNLTFKYDGMGNQVKFITDAYTGSSYSNIADFKYNKNNTAPYAYNKNGAMSYDPNKGMTVVYNPLNLPQELLINNETARGKNYYTYTATGVKLKVRHLSDPTLQTVPVTGTSADSKYQVKNTTDYIGNKIYENEVLNKTLIDNGYIEGNNYYFYIKDHLGNNRIVASAGGTVVQRNNYYPFGMSFGEETDAEQGKQNFKYNGKELDKEHGLNQYDYAARFMDPSMVRFTTVDPLAEKYYSISPYAYVGNNPMNATDPRGDSIWFTIDNNVATMHVTAKLINRSSDNINMNRAANDIAEGIATSFSGSFTVDGKSYSLQTDIQLNVANSMGDVADSDHLFVLSDKSDKPIIEGSRGATNQPGGKVISILASDYANDNWFSNTLSHNNTRSAVHELGHAAGLSHESGGGDVRNLMTQSRAGTSLIGSQRSSIISFYQKGYLNKGRNFLGSGRSKVPYYYYSAPGLSSLHINKIGFNHR